MPSHPGRSQGGAQCVQPDGEYSAVMNMELYDIENIKYLAKQDWMMTCTDGSSAPPGAGTVHPRSFAAFTKKLRDLVLDEGRGCVAVDVRVRVEA